MKFFNYMITFGAWDGVKTDTSITIIGIVFGEYKTYVAGPIRFTKIKK